MLAKRILVWNFVPLPFEISSSSNPWKPFVQCFSCCDLEPHDRIKFPGHHCVGSQHFVHLCAYLSFRPFGVFVPTGLDLGLGEKLAMANVTCACRYFFVLQLHQNKISKKKCSLLYCTQARPLSQQTFNLNRSNIKYVVCLSQKVGNLSIMTYSHSSVCHDCRFYSSMLLSVVNNANNTVFPYSESVVFVHCLFRQWSQSWRPASMLRVFGLKNVIRHLKEYWQTQVVFVPSGKVKRAIGNQSEPVRIQNSE